MDSHGRSAWVTAKILLFKMLGNKLHAEYFTGRESRDHTYRGMRIQDSVGESTFYLGLGMI